MTRLRLCLLAGAGLLILVPALTMGTSQSGHGQNPPPNFKVTVQNVPLPVTGSISASVGGGVDARQSGDWVLDLVPTAKVAAAQSGDWTVGLRDGANVDAAVSGTVEAKQSGDWNVGISGTPTVLVGNDEGAPVPVRNVGMGARLPVQVFRTIDGGGDALTCAEDLYTVPAGKRLVVEFVSYFAYSTDIPVSFMELQVEGGGLPVRIPLVVSNTGPNKFQYVGEVRAYAGPGGVVRVLASRLDNGTSFYLLASIVGYLEDAS